VTNKAIQKIRSYAYSVLGTTLIDCSLASNVISRHVVSTVWKS